MKKKIISLIGFVLFSNFIFGQLNYGFSVGGGYNKDIFYQYLSQIEISDYSFSYKAGIFGNYKIFKGFKINSELNYFLKPSKVLNIKPWNKDNYLENTIYFSINKKKIGFMLGMSNNLYIEKIKFLEKRYTYSILSGISYSINDKLAVKFWYNRELVSHTYPLFEEEPEKTHVKNFHQNYMLTLYYNFN